MFRVSVLYADDQRVTYEEVDQVIAPQSSMRFWSVFLLPDAEGYRTTLFINEAGVRNIEIFGKEDEEEKQEETKIFRPDFLQVVDDDYDPSKHPFPDPEGA